MNQEAKVVCSGASSLLEWRGRDTCVSRCCFLHLIECQDLAHLIYGLYFICYMQHLIQTKGEN